jgi:hypothetical protein
MFIFLKSTQRMINAHYKQRLFSLRDLSPPAFGARAFSTVITSSMVHNLNEKIAGVDCVMR